jgi:repressor LexA
MSRKQLTAKQHSFLQFLAEHVRKQKVWPTYREIVDHFGYRSPNSVTQNLQALAKKGYLTRDQNGYRLIGQRRGLPSSGFPVQGTVEDGTFEISLSINEITLKDLFPELDETFAVRLDNQQAQGIDLDEGGYLLLQDGDIEEGQMVAVLHDGTLAVGRIFRDNGRLRLLHEDGSETAWDNARKSIDPLGRYIGHINQRGLFRSPTAGTLDYTFDEATVTTT